MGRLATDDPQTNKKIPKTKKKRPPNWSCSWVLYSNLILLYMASTELIVRVTYCRCLVIRCLKQEMSRLRMIGGNQMLPDGGDADRFPYEAAKGRCRELCVV